jgi:malonyl-CoA O-methyltransferase
MSVSVEFSKYAKEYARYNIIQDKVATHLLSHLKTQPTRVLDLGCGRGALYEKIRWQLERFVGVDFAQGMLELHPKGENVACFYGDFNDPKLFEMLQQEQFDYILSSSALQWAKDINKVFEAIATMQTPFSLALFTSNTFKTLHETANIQSPLRDAQTVIEAQKNYLDAHFEIINYTLEFENTQDIFRYIKRSGVSGGRNVLSFKQMKHLMHNYPKRYLEFEVVFIWS